MSAHPTSAGFLARLGAVVPRLDAHAGAAAPAGALTSPDPGGHERWEQGQVWAHLAEIVGYWVPVVEGILATAVDGPVPFGRTKADAGRVGAIEAHRHDPVGALHDKLGEDLVGLRALLERMGEADWGRVGAHPKLGDMAMPRIVDFFLVGHLEEHAGQLDELATGGA
ncbi:MAG: hypothetical protein ACT4PW_14550 [Acidimicrobiia bacterium]